MGTEAVRPQFWGVTPGIDRAARGVGVIFVGVAALFTTVGITPVGAVLVWLVCLLVLVLVWRCFLTPYVELTADRVVVRGPLDRREVRYEEIREVRSGMYGLRIQTATEGRVVAWAVQKSKLAEWAGRRTRSDELAEQIEARLPRDAALAGRTR
jgi:Bacterial PH domain